MTLESLTAFFVENLPTPALLLTVGVPGLCWAGGCLFLAGWLRKHRHWKTGYTRKVFHFLIFISAAVIQAQLGLPAVCVFGAAVSVWVGVAIVLGEGHMLYEALAREKDAPHRSLYIIVPYFATLIGGVLANIWFGPVAVVGYLVTGLADAIGEPVGTRFGRHTYRVPSLRSVKSVRSLEGSTAVFLVCLPALAGAFMLLPGQLLSNQQLPFIVGVALVCTLTEAVSPHGWDNALLQLVPSALLAVCSGGLS
jgi:phytol kinase